MITDGLHQSPRCTEHWSDYNRYSGPINRCFADDGRCGPPCDPIVRLGLCYRHLKQSLWCCKYFGCIKLPPTRPQRITGYIYHDARVADTYYFQEYCEEHKCSIPDCWNNSLCLNHMMYNNRQLCAGYLLLLPYDILKICIFYSRILPPLIQVKHNCCTCHFYLKELVSGVSNGIIYNKYKAEVMSTYISHITQSEIL